MLSGGMGAYNQFSQPPLSPPGWVFPVVWTLLYLAMGYASWRVYSRGTDAGQVRLSLVLYGIQLFFNFLWPILFFSLSVYLSAFIWLVVLWLLILVTAVQFYRIEKPAGCLLVPYLIWGAFAGYLNMGIYLLN